LRDGNLRRAGDDHRGKRRKQQETAARSHGQAGM
jgi:hypothetical protein